MTIGRFAPLENEEFNRLFPFFFAWEKNGVIVDAGPSLTKVCPQARPGRLLADVFFSKRPRGELTPEFLASCAAQLFLLEDKSNGRLLRGSLLPAAETRPDIMLATPWITDTDQLREYGLTLDDFGLHDQTLDLLQLLQTQRMVSTDLKLLNESLTRQRTQLREAQAKSKKLALVASNIDQAVVITDADMRVEWVNECFSRIKGLGFFEAQGKFLADLLSNSTHGASIVARVSASLRSDGFFEAEVLDKRCDGSDYWLSLNIRPLANEGGAITNYVAIGRDVTQKKLAEEALHKSEADARRQRDELEWIYNNAPIGLCLIDRDLRYRSVNRRLAQINGLPLEAHIGRRVRDVAPFLAPRIEQAALGVIATGEALRNDEIEGETASQPGVTRYFNHTCHPAIGEDGDIIGASCMIEEITESKRVLAFSEADRRKDEFLATLAHELRNPLSPIKATLQLLQLPNADDPAARDENLLALQKAERQVDHLVRLVEDLLEVARITHGKIELRREETDLLELLPQAVDQIRPHLESRKHKLFLDFQAAALPVSGDKVRLVQVWANLLDNAVKYTPEGGEIHVAARAADREALVAIRDNGVGIPTDKLDHIWELFAQVEFGDKARSGIGIGLALTRHIVQLHGGRVTAFSAGLGRGSEFVVNIPMASQQHG